MTLRQTATITVFGIFLEITSASAKPWRNMAWEAEGRVGVLCWSRWPLGEPSEPRSSLLSTPQGTLRTPVNVELELVMATGEERRARGEAKRGPAKSPPACS